MCTALEHRIAARRQFEAAILVDIDDEITARHRLADQALPEGFRPVPAYTIGRQDVMAAGAYPVSISASEHTDDMTGTEHLAGADNGGKQHLRFARAVEQHGWIQADIAIAAGFRTRLTELGQQGDATALGRFGIG